MSSSIEKLKTIIYEIDSLLEAYKSPEISPERVIEEIMAEQASQNEIFEKAAALASAGLKKFPLHPALLLRRALARRMIMELDARCSFSEVKAAEKDLWTILDLEPENTVAGRELLDLLFTHSKLDEVEVADAAEAMGAIAGRQMADLCALQIQALAYAERCDEAEKLYAKWSTVFPEHEGLRRVHKDIEVFLERDRKRSK